MSPPGQNVAPAGSGIQRLASRPGGGIVLNVGAIPDSWNLERRDETDCMGSLFHPDGRAYGSCLMQKRSKRQAACWRGADQLHDACERDARTGRWRSASAELKLTHALQDQSHGNHMRNASTMPSQAGLGVAPFVGLPTPPEGGRGGIGRERREERSDCGTVHVGVSLPTSSESCYEEFHHSVKVKGHDRRRWIGL